MSDLSFIYFDVGGVLLDWSNVFKTAADTFNLTPHDISTVFQENSEKITKGFMSAPYFWRKCIEKYNIRNAEDYDFLHSWVADYRPIPQIHELIIELQLTYKIGLLSNIYKGMLRVLLEKKLIPDIDYQATIFSCDVGMRKPESEIYELAERKAQTDPEKIFYIDDRDDFLTAAKKRGWQTFLFDGKNIDASVKGIEKYINST